MGLNHFAESYERSGQRFIPLLTEQGGMYCTLDILFLRPEEPHMLLKGGDLDNRIKTLFDALRLPKDLEEMGGKRGNPSDPPVFCLLEDDKLISELHVTCDQLLLLPDTQTVKPNDVFLVVKVTFTPRYGTRMAYFFDH
jgi:hypothetical protein